MKMYRTSYGLNISEKGIEKTTEANVFYKNERTGNLEREAKVATYWKWHETLEDAVMYLKSKEYARIDRAKTDIEEAGNNLSKIFEKYHI